ncbi:hypothetical protein QR77_10170 [Streptomyces sp. 150FB]|nr:hypothetical protein QR77_10170 [Streptomyces sp. 150FB]
MNGLCHRKPPVVGIVEVYGAGPGSPECAKRPAPAGEAQPAHDHRSPLCGRVRRNRSPVRGLRAGRSRGR